MLKCCNNCKHLATLWYWDNYPYNKKYGKCCTLFTKDEKDRTVTVLYGDTGIEICECFEKKEDVND